MRMLYTGKGDNGTSTLYGLPARQAGRPSGQAGMRFSKDDTVFEALGSIDELNTFLGMCRVEVDNSVIPTNDILRSMQNHLFTLQAQLAGADKTLSRGSTEEVEEHIHAIEKDLPPLTHFTIAGEGTRAAAQLDFARTLCRRTERVIIRYHREHPIAEDRTPFSFLNRLSSLLFALARWENHKEEIKEGRPWYKEDFKSNTQ